MIAWLYNHAAWFRTPVNKLLFNQQHINPDLEFAFIDSNGKRYYRYKDDMKLPMVRKGVINHFMSLLTAAITETELAEYVKILRANHQEILDAGKLKSKPFSHIGFILTQLEDRQRWHIHPELCFDLCAVVFLREDEKEGVSYDHRIHNEKVEQFHRDSRSGLLDFFYISGWQTYLPYSNSSPQELKTYVESMVPKVEAQRRILSQLSQTDSSSNEKTS